MWLWMLNETQVAFDAPTILKELMSTATRPEIAYRMHNNSQRDLPHVSATLSLH